MSETERQKHVEYQRRYFDANYGFFRQAIPDDIRERTRVIVKESGIKSGSRVLDVGTGMGVLIEYFLERGLSETDIVGCDLSSKMLAEARTRYPHVTFWQGDVQELPESLGKFDAVFFNACFGNIFDQKQVIGKMRKALRAGGKVIISHPLGNAFVEKLKEQDPKLVLQRLPQVDDLHNWCAEFQFDLVQFADEPQFYLAILQASENGERN
jgi:ubiquinone/menaquinone biosynthesis C-methylase UbiE